MIYNALMFQQQRFALFLGDIASLVAAFFVVWLIVFFMFDLYNLRRVNPNPRNIGLLVAGIITNVLLGVVFFYLFSKDGITPKTNLLLVGLFSLVLLIAWRRLYYHLFTVRFTRSIATVGISPLIADLQSELGKHPHFGELAIHWDNIADATAGTPIHVLITEHNDPQAILATSMSLNAETMTLLESYETFFAKIPVTLMTDERAIAMMTRHDNKAVHFLYRIAEILFAAFILVITSPFLLVAIIARLIEDGRPIFYTHKRVGKNGKLFNVYKLRSMTKDAEQSGAQWAGHKDTRITRLGHILRATHIDEVPQMINIIKGDIALVGPRPERPEFVSQLEQQIPYYFLRHTVRPGFTGWAQIKYRYARSIDDAKDKFEYDLYYIKNRNPLLDVGIVLKTLQIIFTH